MAVKTVRGKEIYREGFSTGIGSAYQKLKEQATHMEDFDPSGAALMRYVAEVIWQIQPDE